jgi:hypothetical protein
MIEPSGMLICEIGGCRSPSFCPCTDVWRPVRARRLRRLRVASPDSYQAVITVTISTGFDQVYVDALKD